MRFLSLCFIIVFASGSLICADDSIKVGATLALTGDGAQWGKNALRGIQLGTERINADGGIAGRRLEVIIEDYRSSEFKLAATAARKFLAVDHVGAILTQWSGDTEVVWPIAASAGVPTFCIGPAPDGLTKKSPLVFRLWPSDRSLVTAVVEYALKRNAKRAVIIGALDPYFADLAGMTKDYWKAQTGISPVMIDIGERTEDFRPAATLAKRNQPDVVFIHTSYDAEGVIVRRLGEVGVRSLIIGTQRRDDSAVLSGAGPYAEGLVYPQFGLAQSVFRNAFLARFGEEPGAPADYAYDATLLAAYALKESVPPPTLKNRLHELGKLPGASGVYEMDQDGNRTAREVEIKVIRNGAGAGATQQTAAPDGRP